MLEIKPPRLLGASLMFNNSTTFAVAVTTTCFAIIWALFILRPSKNGRKLPPGPPGLPILGNVLQVPSTHLATYFKEVIQKYGTLVSLNMAGKTLILIGDMRIGNQLLEKQGAKHSSRPVIYYFSNHIDPELDYWGLREECASHAIARRLTVGIMSLVKAGKTDPLQEFEAMVNVQHLLDDGGKHWFEHINRLAASTVLSATFGLHCPTGHESELTNIIDLLSKLVHLGAPTSSIINVFPFLDWIPGPMPWRSHAQSFRKRHDEFFESIVDEALTGKASGMNTWVGAFASTDKPEGDQRRLVRQFAGAAIETTAVSLHTFVLACIRYPHWVIAAQKEIDDIVGLDRLPTFKDRPYLPFIEAVVRETLRWRPAVRFGIPHLSIEDDVVEHQGHEYFIPKGSIIFAVAWAIEHDKSRYSDDHDKFKPERFLDTEGKLKENYETSAFGFGRRICPGAPFAERSLWIDIATMLWMFNILPSKEIDPKTGVRFEYDDGDAAFKGDLTSAPYEFPAVFEPRSPEREEVARREWAECEKDLNVLLPMPK